jgi:aprataxin
VLVIDPDDRNRAHLEEGVAPLVRRAGGRLTVHVGFITALHLHSLPCRFLACATSWRFRAAGAPASRAVFDCAGAALTADAVAAHRTAAVGRAYAVRLRGDSPLRRTGAQAVLLVAGPNMNPDRPDCLAGDYKAGRALLRRCYDSLFDAFRSQAGLPRAWEGAEAAAVPELAAPRVAKRARAAPEAVAKGEEEEEEEENGGESEEEKRKEAAAASAVAASAASSEGDDEELGPLPELRPPSVAEFEALAPAGGDWRNALGRIMRELPRCRRLVFAETRDVVVVYDRYPKARVHLLALPRPSARLEVEGGPAALRATPETLATLAALKRVGEWVAVGLRRRLGAEAGGALGVRCGFHAQPSLSYLHMHIVSQDFDSPHLKHKHHWNSFTSPFFLEPDALADMVRAGTNALLTSTRAAEFAALLDRPLACHVCRAEVRTMPRLKEHVAACLRRTAAAGRV